MRRFTFLLFVCFTSSLCAQMKEGGHGGVAPGVAAVFGPETGMNGRFYFFPNHKICFGPEVNAFFSEGHDFGEDLEVAFNFHYIFRLSERWGGLSHRWRRVEALTRRGGGLAS